MRRVFFPLGLFFFLQERSLFYGAVDIQQPLMLISCNKNDRNVGQFALFLLFPFFPFSL